MVTASPRQAQQRDQGMYGSWPSLLAANGYGRGLPALKPRFPPTWLRGGFSRVHGGCVSREGLPVAAGRCLRGDETAGCSGNAQSFLSIPSTLPFLPFLPSILIGVFCHLFIFRLLISIWQLGGSQFLTWWSMVQGRLPGAPGRPVAEITGQGLRPLNGRRRPAGWTVVANIQVRSGRQFSRQPGVLDG